MKFLTPKKTALVLVTSAAIGLFAFDTPVSQRYFDIAKNLEIFATLYKEVNTFYVDDVNPNKLVKSGIDAMLNSLDPYTNYIAEEDIEDYRTSMTGQYGGIGAIISKRGDKAVVIMPHEGFPAFNAGLRIGDEIIEVDGVELAKKNTNDVSKLLKGQAGTNLKLKVVKLGQKEPVTLNLTRQKIKLENIYRAMLDNEIGYVRLTDFTPDAGREIAKAITELKQQGAKKLVFDLRDNPGGLLNEAVNISNLFIPKDKEVVSTKGKVSEWNKVYKALNTPLDLDMPLTILVSGRSASASEIVAGVVQDYDRGVLVGQKTFGKGLVQTTRPLVYNSQLKVTTAKYYIPSGRCIQAIDYSKRNDDGTVNKFADSTKRAFKTAAGRMVYDNGGVEVDVKVEAQPISPIAIWMENKQYLFDYANEFYLKHKTIAPARQFKLTDEEYKEFETWVKTKNLDYTTKAETDLNTLVASTKKEKYYDEVKEQIDQLKKQLVSHKDNDLQRHKAEIKELLESQIVGRYYFNKGITEASFDNDPEVQAALKVLRDPAEYARLLKPGAKK